MKPVTFIGGPADLQRRMVSVEARTVEIPVFPGEAVYYGRAEAMRSIAYTTHKYDIFPVPSYTNGEPTYIAVWREKWA